MATAETPREEAFGLMRRALRAIEDPTEIKRLDRARARALSALAAVDQLLADEPPPASGEGRTPREVYAHDLEQPIWDAYLTEHPLADEAPDHWPQWLIAATQAVEDIVNRRSRPEPRAGHHWAPFACGCGARWTEELPLPTDTESVAAVVCGKCAAELLPSAPEARTAREVPRGHDAIVDVLLGENLHDAAGVPLAEAVVDLIAQRVAAASSAPVEDGGLERSDREIHDETIAEVARDLQVSNAPELRELYTTWSLANGGADVDLLPDVNAACYAVYRIIKLKTALRAAGRSRARWRARAAEAAARPRNLAQALAYELGDYTGSPVSPVEGDARAVELLERVADSHDGWSAGLDPDLRDDIDEWAEARRGSA